MLLQAFELPAVADIGLQLVHACEYMHSKQIIHTGIDMYMQVNVRERLAASRGLGQGCRCLYDHAIKD